MAWVGRFTTAPFDPDRLNPMLAGRRAAGPDDDDGADGWALLGSGLRAMARKR